MTYQFGGMLYRNSREMHAAIAEQWLTAGGANDRDVILDALAENDTRVFVDEILNAWDIAENPEYCYKDLWNAFEDIRTNFDEYFPEEFTS